MQSQNIKNLKALKNMSPQVQNLIEHRPLQNFANKMALDDSNRFMTMNLKKRQPIFKNHTKTNSSILRSEIQCKKKETMSYNDSERQSFLDKVTIKSSVLDRVKRTGPTQVLNSLMKQSATIYEPNKLK